MLKRSQFVLLCIVFLMGSNLITAETLDIAEVLVLGQESNFTISGEKLFKIILPREDGSDQPNTVSIKTSLLVSNEHRQSDLKIFRHRGVESYFFMPQH